VVGQVVPTEEVLWGKHPNIICSECLRPIGAKARFRCLNCDAYDLCEDCEDKDQEHANGKHYFGKIRDSTALDPASLSKYKAKISTMNLDADSFTYRKSRNHAYVRQNMDMAYPLIKDMLVVENKYRLSKEYLDEYAKSQTDGWKVAVTVAIQTRVINEFMDRGKALGLFDTVEAGIDFLRAAVGNFPEKMEELKECANYVRYTAFCVRGHLKVGDSIDGSELPLYDPYTLQKEYLSDFLKQKNLY